MVERSWDLDQRLSREGFSGYSVGHILPTPSNECLIPSTNRIPKFFSDDIRPAAGVAQLVAHELAPLLGGQAQVGGPRRPGHHRRRAPLRQVDPFEIGLHRPTRTAG